MARFAKGGVRINFGTNPCGKGGGECTSLRMRYQSDDQMITKTGKRSGKGEDLRYGVMRVVVESAFASARLRLK